MGNVLIIDDDQMMCKAMAGLLRREGHEVVSASTLQSGMQKASTEPFDIVLLDVMMPDGNGLNVVTEIRDTYARPEVIIITAAGDPDSAELAIRSGAWDYVEKSYSLKKMILPVSRVLQYRKEKLKNNLPAVLEFEGIIGNSPKMKACMDLLAQAGRSDVNVLLTGETGTGKELFARAIHNHWRQNNNGWSADTNLDKKKQKDRNFVVVDCTALPETLVESVLFGHVKGAFTGADRSQEGLIKQADGGTLFLDEIGELPHKIQKRFLRVLQERCFRPVGGKDEMESNFRLIAATNRNLAHMVENKKFREDLLFRLQSLTIELPPLRERSIDIIELVKFHVTRLCERNRGETKSVSPDLFDALQAYTWPGNVRELVNTLEGALAVAGEDPILFSKHLPVHIRVHLARRSVDVNKKNSSNPDTALDLNKSFPDFRAYRQSSEKNYLQKLISYSKRDIKRACQISGLSRSRLYELLSKYRLSMSGDQ